MQRENSLRVSDVARAANVHVQTLHYYERRGLLPTPRRTTAGYRVYSPGTVQHVRAIKRAQALGFTLADIRQLMAPAAGSNTFRELVSRKLSEIDGKIRDLHLMKRSLKRGIAHCRCDGDPARCDLFRAPGP